jgi:hypothetical protein
LRESLGEQLLRGVRRRAARQPVGQCAGVAVVELGERVRVGARQDEELLVGAGVMAAHAR